MAKPERLRVLDMPVDAVTMASALDFVDAAVTETKRGQLILAMNPEKVIALQADPELRGFFESAALLIPDGIGLVVATRWLRSARLGRVAGADLMQNICGLSARKGYSVFLYGASEEVNRGSAEILAQRYPGLAIAGRCNGYVGEDQMEALVQQINDSAPNILFVALGSPRQEQWVSAHLDRLDVSVIQCIGGTLDTIVGTVKRAPILFQKAGLEWFYRLLREPKRVLRQKALPLFTLKVIKEIARFK